jgi:hypothetical protein
MYVFWEGGRGAMFFLLTQNFFFTQTKNQDYLFSGHEKVGNIFGSNFTKISCLQLHDIIIIFYMCGQLIIFYGIW